MLWELLSRDEADPALAATASALARDPRRLVAIVGESGTGFAAACALAATFPAAFARDRLAAAGDGLDELRNALSAAGEGAAAIVLDGPDDADALALLPALLAHGMGRELRVIVPCDRHRATRLAFIAGAYPRASIAVVATAEASLVIPTIEESALPLLLAGRLPAGRLEGEASLLARGLAARHAATGDLVCLLGTDTRAELLRDAGPAAVAAAVRHVLSLAPSQRQRLLRGAAAAGFTPDDDLADKMCEFDTSGLPAPLDWIRRGTPLPGWALRAIDRRAASLGAGFGVRAWIARLEDRADEALALVEKGLSRSAEPCTVAKLSLLRAEWSGSTELADEAVRRACEAGAAATRAALAHRAAWNEAAGDLEAAFTDQAEIERSAEGDDALATAAAAAIAQARILEAMQRTQDAAASAGRAAVLEVAIGDTARAAFAWVRAANLHAAARSGADAEAAARAACVLGERTGDQRLVGYARWFLGALAERHADPATAAIEYGRSLDAYAALGDVPDRLLPSLERARAAADGRSAQLAESADVQIPVDAALAKEPIASQAGG